MATFVGRAAGEVLKSFKSKLSKFAGKPLRMRGKAISNALKFVTVKPYKAAVKAIEKQMSKSVIQNDQDFYKSFLGKKFPFQEPEAEELKQDPLDGEDVENESQGYDTPDENGLDTPFFQFSNDSGIGINDNLYPDTRLDFGTSSLSKPARTHQQDFSQGYSGSIFKSENPSSSYADAGSTSQSAAYGPYQETTPRMSAFQPQGLSIPPNDLQTPSQSPSNIEFEIIPDSSQQSLDSNQTIDSEQTAASEQTNDTTKTPEKPQTPQDMIGNIQKNLKSLESLAPENESERQGALKTLDEDLKALSEQAEKKILEQPKDKNNTEELESWQDIHYALHPDSKDPGTLGEALEKEEQEYEQHVKEQSKLRSEQKSIETKKLSNAENKNFDDIVIILAKNMVRKQEKDLRSLQKGRLKLLEDRNNLDKHDPPLNAREHKKQLEAIMQKGIDAAKEEHRLETSIDAFKNGKTNKYELARDYAKHVQAEGWKTIQLDKKEFVDALRAGKEIQRYIDNRERLNELGEKIEDSLTRQKGLLYRMEDVKENVSPILDGAKEKQEVQTPETDKNENQRDSGFFSQNEPLKYEVLSELKQNKTCTLGEKESIEGKMAACAFEDGICLQNAQLTTQMGQQALGNVYLKRQDIVNRSDMEDHQLTVHTRNGKILSISNGGASVKDPLKQTISGNRNLEEIQR